VVDRAYALYRLGSAVTRGLPAPLVDAVGEVASRSAARAGGERRFLVERNLRRVLGPDVPQRRIDRLVGDTFADYVRYYTESARLPDMSVEEIDAGFTYEGVGNIDRAVASGIGPILVLPHLGGWEWAGFWLTLVPRYQVTVVVEPLQPPELHDWFVRFREQLGMNVVPLGPDAAAETVRAIKAGHVVCLLSDRAVGGASVEVDFFGETTRLPAGPATLALRTGCHLLPTGVYHADHGTHAIVRPDVAYERQGPRLRDDITALTQLLAREMEWLIRQAPEQWHLMQPNWPSDHEALAGLG